MIFSILLGCFLAAGYMAIAWQFWRHTKTAESKAKRSLLYMVGIFLLCGLTHLFHSFGMHGNIILVTLVPLVIITWAFVARQEIVRMVDALERDAVVYAKLKDK